MVVTPVYVLAPFTNSVPVVFFVIVAAPPILASIWPDCAVTVVGVMVPAPRVPLFRLIVVAVIAPLVVDPPDTVSVVALMGPLPAGTDPPAAVRMFALIAPLPAGGGSG